MQFLQLCRHWLPLGHVFQKSNQDSLYVLTVILDIMEKFKIAMAEITSTSFHWENAALPPSLDCGNSPKSTNLQTRWDQEENSEQSNRAQFESVSDELNAQFQIPRQAKLVEAEEWLRRLLTPLYKLLPSIPSRTMYCNGPEGVPVGERETLHQLQVLKNQTSSIKIFAVFP